MIWPVLDASIVRLLNVFSSYGSNIAQVIKIQMIFNIIFLSLTVLLLFIIACHMNATRKNVAL